MRARSNPVNLRPPPGLEGEAGGQAFRNAGRLLSVGQGLIELDVGNRLRICGIEPGGPIETQSTDRLRRSWDPNWDPKLPETGRILGELERTTDPLTP